MKNIIILYTVVFMLFASCNKTQKQEKDDMKCYEFSLETVDKDLMKDLSVEFQALELTDKSVVGSIDQIVEHGDTIFVSDGSEYRLLAFYKNGNFIAQVGSRGEGPGEYTGIASYFVDPAKSRIGIYDEDVSKMLYYNLNDFSFIDEKSYEGVVAGCCLPFGDSLIWYNQAFEGEDSDSYFIVTDSGGKVTSSFVKKEFKSGYLTGCSTPMYTCDGKVYGYTPYSPVVYELTDSDAKIAFEMEFKDFDMPSVDYLNQVSSSGQSNSLFKTLRESGLISYYSVSETTSTICITVMVKGEKYCGIVDKATGRTAFMTLDDMARELGVGAIRYFIPGSLGDCVLAMVDPMEVKERIAEGEKVDDSLKSMVENSDDNANPIIAKIAFYKL